MKTYKSLMNQDWQFAGPEGNVEVVRLPHTWNGLDGQDGGNDYYRGICTYTTTFQASAGSQSVYLEFHGVNSSADVFLNKTLCCHHDGGYSTFRAEVTNLLKEENTLTVAVDNRVNDRVYPQKADFTFYGGIYREVTLLTVHKKHFNLDDYGGQGVTVTSALVGDQAMVTVTSDHNAPEGEVFVSILDRAGEVAGTGQGSRAVIALNHPHRWNGVKDPYLYQVVVTLKEGEHVLDQVCQPLGIRSFYVDKDKGFFLNGQPYPLRGVSRHQDRKGMGNALTREDHEEDLRLILEMGANSIRLAHYQHSQYFYDRCDQLGLIVWAEIPYISEHLPKAKENSISQMKELIVQNQHHPSIVCWGVSNEITISTKDNKDMLAHHQKLNDLCHKMDPTRLTTLACYAMCPPTHKVAHITDLVGWNLYLGWYVPGLFLNDWWIGFFHLLYPKRPLGFSEYGCEGMPNLHKAHPRRGDHSEEYQANYHEFMLRCFRRHPYMWGNYVWNMFDFAADARDQGGEPGMNHKGLVTFDRQIKKDSFFLYKAFWSEDPFVHIGGKRMEDRCGRNFRIKVYTNQPFVKLYRNEKLVEEKPADHVVVFKIPAEETVKIRVEAGGQSDWASFRHVEKPNPAYSLKKSKKTKKSNWV